jgi:isorenieratene synthase
VRRRDSLALLGPAALAAACRATPPDPRVHVALAELPIGGRTVVSYAGEPVEVVRSADGIIARSLLCTHFGCRVVWEPGRERYRCPCHAGWFDAAGRPVAGPPTLPLRALPVVAEGDAALVGGR